MHRWILLSLLAVLPTLTFHAAPLEPEVVLSVQYDAEARTLEGTLEITWVPESDITYFSLLANLGAHANPHLSARHQDATYPYGFEPSRITVLSVERLTSEGATAVPFRLLALPPSWQTYSLEETVLAVDTERADQTESITLRCAFLTDAPRTTRGDEGITDGVLTWRFGWFPTLLPEAARIVENEGVIRYQDSSSFPLVFPWTRLSGTFTVPAGFHLLTGTDVLELSVDEASSQWQYTVANETPSRSLAIGLGQEYARYVLEGPTDIEVFYLPPHEREARLLATWAREILADFSARYGSYPRAKLRIAETPASGGQAFAADGIVWLSSRFFTHRDVLFPGALDRVTEFVLAHEIAHQWVGLGTGIDLDAEAWLSEGLAQYLSIRYFEDRYGAFGPNLFSPPVPGIAGEIVTRQWGYLNLREHFIELPYYLSLQAGFDEPLILPTENVQFGNARAVRLYDKGYLVARAIAAMIGDDAFERALGRAIEERRADLLDVRSFQSMLEDASGQSLETFFDFWVLEAGTADYSIRILDRRVEGDVHITRVRVARDGGVPQPVSVEATMASKATVRQSWDGEDRTSELEFTTPTAVDSVTIDPDHLMPDRDRLNNHSPVKFVAATNKNVLPLDAYVIAPDQASGGIILSHLDRLRVFISQTEASATVRMGRAHRLSIRASFTGTQLGARIAYAYTGYDQPETGSAATYWIPAHTLTVTGQRHVTPDGGLLSVRLDVTDLPSPDTSGVRTAMVRLASGVAQLQFTAFDELRLLPRMYLQAQGRLGVSSGQVPSVLMYTATEMKGVSLPRSPHLAVARFALDTAAGGAVPYSLFHIAMIDSVRSVFFFTMASRWTSPGDFGTTSIKAEAGLEQIIELSTLGGLLSLTARIGVATPVRGLGMTTIYGNLSF